MYPAQNPVTAIGAYQPQPFGNVQYPQPYQSPVSQYPQMQAAQQPQATQPTTQYIIGRVIESTDDMRSCTVPLDGVAVFPMRDESCIYTRSYNMDGTIATKRFTPEQVAAAASQPDIFEVVNERFDKLESMLQQPTTSTAKKSTNRSAKGSDDA